MDFSQLITSAKAARDQAQARFDERSSQLKSIMDLATSAKRDFTADEQARIEVLVTERKAARQEIDARNRKIGEYEIAAGEEREADEKQAQRNPGASLPGGDGNSQERKIGGAVITKEERTYDSYKSARGLQSFFADAYALQGGDMEAQLRLQRHGKEVRVEGEKVGKNTRAQTTTTFAGLVVPQYLVDLVALLVRSGRPFLNTCLQMELPDKGMSFIIPRGTTGAAVASQTPENTSAQNTDEVWANLTVNVATIAGQQDVSRQSLERGTPGLDELVYMDLAGAYMAELDRQGLNGLGSGNQMLGMFKTGSVGQATAFGAAPTWTLFNSKVAGQVAGVAGSGVGIVPRLIVMHPRRWGWMNTLLDTTGRNIVVPQANGAFNAGALNLKPGGYGGDSASPTDSTTVKFVGSMQGLDIFTDANVPIAVGTESEDLVGVYDPYKQILWEDGDGMPNQLKFEQTLGNQLTVKLVAYGYAAFTAGRYPQAVGIVGGQDVGGATFGLVAPTF